MNTIRIVLGFAVVYAFVTNLSGCGSDSGGGAASCASVCSRVTAAHCANDPDCMTQCAEAKKETPSGCTSAYNALANCFSTATFTCDDQEQSEAKACSSQQDAWQSCIANDDSADAGAGGSGSGGKSGGDQGSGGKSSGSGGSGSSAMCNGKTATTPCDACLASSCCSELTACQGNDDCVTLAACVDDCGDDTCVQSCADAASQAAVDLYNASITCANDHCTSDCSGGDTGSGGSSSSGGSSGSGGSTGGNGKSGVGAPNDGDTGFASPSTPPDCLDVPPDITGYCGDVKYKVIYDCPNGAPYSDCVMNTMDSSGIYCCGH